MLQESCDAIVAELRAQVQRLQEAAVERETAFSQKVQETTKGVDAAFTELKDTAQALAETNAEKEAQTQELSRLPMTDISCATKITTRPNMFANHEL